MKNKILLFILMFFVTNSFSQDYSVPVLEINTNTRLAGFGEVGVVSSPFYYNTGLYQNPALISKNNKYAGIEAFYMPWLKKFNDDMSLSGFAGSYAIDSSNAFAVNFTYFDIGHIVYSNGNGEFFDADDPYEMFIKIAYNHSFNKSISTGIAFKYFRSDMIPPSYQNANIVNSIAFDLGVNYEKRYSLHNSSFINTSAGAAITNLGPKVSYSDDADKQFIPTKLSLGLLINPDINIKDKFRLNIELAYQADKYLVPSDPTRDINGNIVDGYDTDISAFTALYQSFYDAPDGFSEEIDEIGHKFGSEFRFSYMNYWYAAFRHGRRFEHESKGNRNYQTFGYGIGLFGLTLDYMRIKADSDSWLDKTWSITLGYVVNLDKNFFQF